MKLSEFGEKFTNRAGILTLMDDLGHALAEGGEDMIMMGGGNPGDVSALQSVMQQRFLELGKDAQAFKRLIGVYDPPQGYTGFVKSLASLLKKEYGWQVGPENICLTNGSQSGFFFLFNMFGGRCSDGVSKKIRLPLAPEYIGYADIGLEPDLFVATRPKIEELSDHLFKYHVDFDGLVVGEETGAICVSRPTNPTGNVITDAEVAGLDILAKKHDIPLILDNAYGIPFPGMIFTDATPVWNSNMIVCLSLSKLGLPGVRTGIIVAREEIIKAVAGMNAIINLAPGTFGPTLAHDIVASGEIVRLSRTIIKPFYEQKGQRALDEFRQQLTGTPYRIHKPEGAMFLWLWFEDLPITSLELYERLKQRGVVVVSGHYFFPGLDEPWKHKDECLRVNYSQDWSRVKKGIQIIAEEVKLVYQGQ